MTQPAYDSHAEFYQQVYGHAVREVRPAGRTGAVMMRAEQPAGDWSDAPSPDLVVSVLTHGQARSTIDVGAGRFASASGPGEWAVVPPGVSTTFLVDAPHAVRLIAIPYAALRQLAGEDSGLPADGDFGQLHTRLHREPAVAGLLAGIWDEGARGSPHGALFADGAQLQLASLLMRMAATRHAPAPRGGLAPWQLRRLTDYLQDRLAQDVSLAELGALVGLSTAHLCRAFKQSTGMPPHQWRQARRMERARELLATTPLPVTDVAARVGYGEPGQFAATFRRATGFTPTQYRRERRA